MLDLAFPVGGISELEPVFSQNRDYTKPTTTYDARNVRGYDPRTGRLRGAQRAGHSRFLTDQHSSTNFIQHITHITSTAAWSGSGSYALRTTSGIAVSNGNVKTFTRGGSYTTATNGSGALSTTFPYVDSAELFGVLYFVDGESVKKYTASSTTVATWTPSAGSLPGSGSTRARLICTWRSRIVLSGLSSDPHNWFMSKVGDALDWDYGATTSETMAVAGNNSTAGKCADIINTLIPFNDDLLIFGGDHTIWQMTNDPMAGGRIDRISDGIGMAFGQSWCKSPDGIIYFFGSRGGVYALAPNNLPKLLSGPVNDTLRDVDLETHVIKMAYDEECESVMVYITPVAGGTATNYCYDTRQAAWWRDSWVDDDLNVTATHVFDGDDPNDRKVLIGCLDGRIRYIDTSTSWDDETLTHEIDSYVWFGPYMAKSLSAIRSKETRLYFANNTTDSAVSVGVYASDTAENTYASTAKFSYATTDTEKYSERMRALGKVLAVKVASATDGTHWSYERGYMKADELSAASGRMF